MRENRPYGSEGGARFYSSLLPLSSELALYRFHTAPEGRALGVYDCAPTEFRHHRPRMRSLGLLLGWGCYWMALAAGVGTSMGAERPNVLLLLADDMRADSVAALGNPDIQTPHLDALVRQGFAMR